MRDPMDVMKRDQRARKMQSFYEPAWFGQKTNYGGMFSGFADTSPTTMGGFQHMPRSYVLGDVGESIDPALTAGLQDDYLTRQVFDRTQPQYGKGQLQQYGKGALKPYGKGALPGYGQAIEELWRR